jgi:hypothetical protein
VKKLKEDEFREEEVEEIGSDTADGIEEYNFDQAE